MPHDDTMAISALRAAVASQPGSEWADDATCARYLRARNGNHEKARAMLCETLAWRLQFGTATLSSRSETLRAESATGKLYVSQCTDRTGRSVLVMKPGSENTKGHTGQLTNLV